MHTRTKIFRTRLAPYLEGKGYQWKHDAHEDYTVETQIYGDYVYHIVTYIENV